MMMWIAENLGTIAVTFLLIIIVGAAAASIIKDKKQGRTSCGCGCANCAMKGKCHPSPKLQEAYDAWKRENRKLSENDIQDTKGIRTGKGC